MENLNEMEIPAEKPKAKKVEKYYVKVDAFKKRTFFIDGEFVTLEGGQEISKELYFRFTQQSRDLMFEKK